ncbi:hypothetical protein N7G274_007570 [Stereocaulon virgatum]|uniref:UBC core domain-containing protein n=1 Tax=Stereocaulon virgatum TaxID=373712 RepID=A0ABR4A454_9LECA
MSRGEETYLKIYNHLLSVVEGSGPTLEYERRVNLERPSASMSSGSVTLSSTSKAPAEPQYQFWRPTCLRVFYKYLQRDITELGRPWEVLDEEYHKEVLPSDNVEQRSRKFRGGTFSFCYPGYESTIIILTISSTTENDKAEWTIRSPNSTYHPGRHDGHLRVGLDFPFRRPQVTWDSPILSPYVNPYGQVCFTNEDQWSPRRSTFYEYLHTLAAIVIFGPELNITSDPAAPMERVERLGSVCFMTRVDVYDTEEDWKMRATNLFSRVYNRMDDDDDLNLFDGGSDNSPLSIKISDADRQTSITAIEDVYNHLAPHNDQFHTIMAKHDKTNVRQAFEEVLTLRKLLETERVWVDALNDACGNVACHGWGRAESFRERQERMDAQEGTRAGAGQL